MDSLKTCWHYKKKDIHRSGGMFVITLNKSYNCKKNNIFYDNYQNLSLHMTLKNFDFQ